MKDPADVCQFLAPLGQEERLRVLRAWLFGEGLPPDPDPERAERKWPNGDRLALAWNLATNIDDCAALIRGQYVDPARLDQDWLRWAKREQFVALKPAIECL